MEIQQMQSPTSIIYKISTFAGLIILLGIFVITAFWSTSYFFSWLF